MLDSTPMEDPQRSTRAPHSENEPSAPPPARPKTRIASDVASSSHEALDLAAQLSDVAISSGPVETHVRAALRIGARLLPGVAALELLALDARSPRQVRSLGYVGGAEGSAPCLFPMDGAAASLGLGSDVDERVFERGQITQTGSTLCLPLSTATGSVLGALVLTLKSAATPGAAERVLLTNTLRTLLQRRVREAATQRANDAALRIQRFADAPEDDAAELAFPESATEDILYELAGAAAELLESSRVALLVSDGTAHVLDGSTAVTVEADVSPRQIHSLFQAVTTQHPQVMSASSGVALWNALSPVLSATHIAGSEARSSVLILPISVDGAAHALIVVAVADADAARQHAALLSAMSTAAGAALALHHSNEVAQERTRAYDSFISMTAHELRSPLTTVKGYAQLLLRQSRKVQLPELIVRSVDAIEQQASRMSDMIDALLDAARIRRGRLEIATRRVNLPHLLTEWVEQWRTEYPAHQLRLDVTATDLEVDVDPRRLHQAVRALIDNAARYSAPESTIDITLLSEEGRLVLRVVDEGIGIAAADREHIFEYLYRAPAAEARNLSGLGLGLFLARNIVELHGGTLQMEATMPERPAGSVFCLKLPLLQG